jgi:hypothetical protein
VAATSGEAVVKRAPLALLAGAERFDADRARHAVRAPLALPLLVSHS